MSVNCESARSGLHTSKQSFLLWNTNENEKK